MIHRDFLILWILLKSNLMKSKWFREKVLTLKRRNRSYMASFAKLRRTRRGEKSWICLILRVKGRYKLAKLKIKSLCEIVDAKLYCATYIIKEKKHIYLGIYTHFHICLENNGRRWLPSSVWRHGDLGRPLSLLSQHRRPAKRI